MNTKTFNENYEIDRKSKSVKALPKHAKMDTACEIMIGAGAPYDPSLTYFYFDEQSSEIRQSLGLRRNEEFLMKFGLKVVAISKLRINRDDTLADGQSFFKSEIERLQKQIQKFELEKTSENRSLKAFLMSKD